MNSLTITAKTGPGQQVTTQQIQNVIAMDFDYNAQTLKVQTSDRIIYFQLYGVTTVTDTISGGFHTWVVS